MNAHRALDKNSVEKLLDLGQAYLNAGFLDDAAEILYLAEQIQRRLQQPAETLSMGTGKKAQRRTGWQNTRAAS